MTFYVENEENIDFGFPVEEMVKKAAEAVLLMEKCPYETEVNVLITDAAGIREYNRQYREIDRATDVLSFPNVDYDSPSDFSIAEADKNDYFNPDTGELYLGDIIICAEKIFSQAAEYGHSTLREFSFLIVHSMLHLLGYDHMEKEDEILMLSRQEDIMSQLGISR